MSPTPIPSLTGHMTTRTPPPNRIISAPIILTLTNNPILTPKPIPLILMGITLAFMTRIPILAVRPIPKPRKLRITRNTSVLMVNYWNLSGNGAASMAFAFIVVVSIFELIVIVSGPGITPTRPPKPRNRIRSTQGSLLPTRKTRTMTRTTEGTFLCNYSCFFTISFPFTIVSLFYIHYLLILVPSELSAPFFRRNLRFHFVLILSSFFHYLYCPYTFFVVVIFHCITYLLLYFGNFGPFRRRNSRLHVCSSRFHPGSIFCSQFDFYLLFFHFY